MFTFNSIKGLAVGVCAYFFVSCGVNKGDSDETPKPVKLDLNIYSANLSVPSNSPIELSLYIINRSTDTVTIKRFMSNIRSVTGAGWLNKEINGSIYNGPATSVVAPRDSAYFGYDDIRSFFDSIPTGQTTIRISYAVAIEGRDSLILLSDSFPINILPALSMRCSAKTVTNSGQEIPVWVINSSLVPVTIYDSSMTIDFPTVEGWEKRSITVIDHSGPGFFTLQPRDSIKYSLYLKNFFSRFAQARKTVRFSFSPGAYKNGPPVIFTDSIEAEIK